MCCQLISKSSALTFAWVASLHISGNADNGQGVDACKAKQQGEEAIHLKREKKRERNIEIEGVHIFKMLDISLQVHFKLLAQGPSGM